jgi:dTDP-4-dehydrorhamnose reductase
MKILLLGKNGQLGYEAERTLFCLGDVTALDYPQIDFTNPTESLNFVREIKPDLIYNAVAYTNVDKAESEGEKAVLINSSTVGEIARYCQKNGIPLVHFSTDYVFDGRKNDLYVETDTPNPLNMYGSSKLAGEQAIIESGCMYFIFRTSWVYSLREGGFVKKVLAWAKQNDELRIVDDQIGNPTWARMLAQLSVRVLPGKKEQLRPLFEEKSGIYHLAGGGYASRLEWAKAILELWGKDDAIKTKRILPAKTSEFPSPAERPLFSALSCEKFEQAFGVEIPWWKKLLELMIRGE